MSASGSRVTDEINLDEFERRLRAAGAQQARAEDPLAELSRLVEFSHMGISNGETPARRVAGAAAAQTAAPLTSIENETLRPTLDEEVEELAPGASEADRAARQDYEFEDHGSDGVSAAEPGEERRPMRWKLAVSGLALAGVAMIGAVFVLKGGASGFKTDPPFIAAAQGPTKVAPPTDQTVTASNDAGATLLKNNVKPGDVKVVNSEEQPIDLSAQASVGNPSSNSSAAADQAPASATDANALAATINTPLVTLPAEPPRGMAPEFPEPKPVRTISLRPDGTPIGVIAPLDQPPSDPKLAAAPAAAPINPPAAAPVKPAEAPVKPAPKTASDAAGVAQPSTPKLDLPTKLSPPKSSARVVVGKADTTAPEATETTGATAQTPVDATAATTSGGWAVQLAAPRSEAEAHKALTRLTSKYGAELNGSPIGVHKAVVKGETIYRLRVVGLTKADAAALCARLKGEGGECFIAK